MRCVKEIIIEIMRDFLSFVSYCHRSPVMYSGWGVPFFFPLREQQWSLTVVGYVQARQQPRTNGNGKSTTIHVDQHLFLPVALWCPFLQTYWCLLSSSEPDKAIPIVFFLLCAQDAKFMF